MDSYQNRHATQTTIDYLEAQLVLAQKALDRAQEEYDHTNRLSSADPLRANATTNLYNAQQAYNRAQGNLNWYTNPPSENDMALANADLDAASAALQEAQWYLSELKGESIPSDATGAELAQLQQAKDDLRAAQEKLAQTRLVAPFAGVIGSVNVTTGEYATPGQSMIIVSDSSHLQVETTDLSERDITKVKIGDSASIFIEALNINVDGEVTGISPIANTVGGDVVYKVILTFEEQPEGLLRGMTAEVTIGK